MKLITCYELLNNSKEAIHAFHILDFIPLSSAFITNKTEIVNNTIFLMILNEYSLIIVVHSYMSRPMK